MHRIGTEIVSTVVAPAPSRTLSRLAAPGTSTLRLAGRASPARSFTANVVLLLPRGHYHGIMCGRFASQRSLLYRSVGLRRRGFGALDRRRLGVSVRSLSSAGSAWERAIVASAGRRSALKMEISPDRLWSSMKCSSVFQARLFWGKRAPQKISYACVLRQTRVPDVDKALLLGAGACPEGYC